jgi:sensor histidine kinase YesM
MNFGIKLPWPFWIVQSAHLCLLVLLFYINSLKMVPGYLVRGKFAAFAVWCAIAITIPAIVNTVLDHFYDLQRLFDEAVGIKKPREPINIYILITTLLVLGISTSAAMIQHLQKEKQSRQSLEQRQTSTELSLLKSQIHPHFYFNTLNNIYALTFIDATSARESLLKLSRMMRYLLYENHEQVALSREIGFIKDYIELMRMRLLENTRVELLEPAEIVDYPIYPMLLVTFVENAFKHGTSSRAEGVIRVRYYQEKNRFFFEVENTIARTIPEPGQENSGIGLANTRRRLDLLYSGKYSLTVKEKEGKKYYILLEMEL